MDGRIVEEGECQQLNLWRHDEDDFVVHRMTGDRLRQFHAQLNLERRRALSENWSRLEDFMRWNLLGSLVSLLIMEFYMYI